MNLYEIKQKIDEFEKAIFSLNEMARIIEKEKPIASIYLNRMIKKNLIFKIEKNKFSKTLDIFIIASQVTSPAYLGLSTSLYLQNEFLQVIDKIYVFTSRQKKRLKVFGTQIEFIKVKPSMVFGYKKVKKENSFIFISNLEKTILDILLFQKYIHLGSSKTLIELIKKSDVERLTEYTKIINKEFITRKIGFLLDLAKMPNNLKRKTKRRYKFNPKIKNKGTLNKKWLLYVNEEIK